MHSATVEVLSRAAFLLTFCASTMDATFTFTQLSRVAPIPMETFPPIVIPRE